MEHCVLLMFAFKKTSVISVPVLKLMSIKDSSVLDEACSCSQCAVQHTLTAMPSSVQSTPAEYPAPAWELSTLTRESQYWHWRDE